MRSQKIRENPRNPWLKPPRCVEENSIIVAIIVVSVEGEEDTILLRYH